MARFLFDSKLIAEVESLFQNAKEVIWIISPYIKLHDRITSILRTHKNNPDIEIIVVFGKNEGDYAKSMAINEVNFFKDFPNIELRYERRLHAKFFSNESISILTSMNLHSFSQDHNIEVGILTKRNILKELSNNIVNSVTGEKSLDIEADDYFGRVIEQSLLLYKREPRYESAMLGLSEKYIRSEITVDKLSEFFDNKNNPPPKEKQKYEGKIGYCIRTGKQIPFNLDKPMCEEALAIWSKFKKREFPENFCHYSGEPSNGETSYAKPVLKKYYHKIKTK